jgi:hypothetical protein
MKKLTHTALLLYGLLCGLVLTCWSCTSVKSYSIRYYRHNKSVLDSIVKDYNDIASDKPLSFGFTNKQRTRLSFELMTDDVRHIREFHVSDTTAIVQTLREYHYPVRRIARLLSSMKRIHTQWISTDNYYVPYNDTGYLRGKYVYLSIRPTDFHAPFASNRYYVLYYLQRSFVRDSLGKELIQKSGLRPLNASVYYKISTRFR